MRSEEPKQTHCLQDLLDDADLQRRAHAWAEKLVRGYQLEMTGEDLFQQVIAKLVRSKKPLEIEHPRAFMFIVLKNQARTSFQVVKDRVAKDKTVGLEDVPSSALSDNFDTVQRMESRILLKEAYRSLNSEEERELFVCVLKGYSSRQVAIIFNISHVTAAHRMTQLKARLRKAMLLEDDPEQKAS